jgi:hypothetical protein
MSLSKQLLPLTKRTHQLIDIVDTCDAAASTNNDWFIPIKPAKRLVAWKPGQQAALERGINLRKHRESADLVHQAKRRGQHHIQYAQSIYALPSRDPIYGAAMSAIRAHQGKPMHSIMVESAVAYDLESFGRKYARSMYVLSFILEELREKGWSSSALQFEPIDAHTGRVVLVADFSSATR